MMQGGQVNRGATQQSRQVPNVNIGPNNQFLDMFNMVMSSRNPNMLISQLALRNPAVANVMNLVNQYGGDPKRAFYSEASKIGVDPNQILNELNRSGQTK